MALKKCETCGAEFEPKTDKSRACSRTCLNRLISAERKARHIQTKACVICGAEFSFGAKDWKRETCSPKCGYKLRGQKTARGERRNCLTCGKSFYVKQAQINGISGGGSYCSKRCMYDRNKAETNRVCICCGKPFKASPSVKSVSCSLACAYRHFSGERRPNYKGRTYVVEVDGKRVSRRTVVAGRMHSNKRRLLIGLVTPAWADLDAMLAIYDECERMAEMTGVKYHADHIVPLKHPLVCGLHNHFNLMPLPAIDNIRKGNRHWPDMP